MGDLGGPLLSSSIEALPTRSKSGALHVENCLSPVSNIHVPSDQSRKSLASTMGKDSACHGLPDTPLQKSAVNSPPEATTPTSDAPCKRSPGPLTAEAFKAARDSASRSNSTDEYPTPFQLHFAYERHCVEDGPKAGKEIADWRLGYVKFLYEKTKKLTIDKRAQLFDDLIKYNQDDCQAIATYFSEHPEHIPEREMDAKVLKKISEAWSESPKFDMAQQKCFGNWMAKEDKWGPRTTEVAPDLGPMNEPTPDDLPPECAHCIKEEKKANSFLRRTVRKLSLSKTKNQEAPRRTRRATEGTRDNEWDVTLQIPESTPEDRPVDESAEEVAKDDASSSSGGKEREAHTETGMNIVRAIPRERRSFAQKMGLSTVRTI